MLFKLLRIKRGRTDNMSGRYLIIADDFTGANDTGVQIRRYGKPVRVVFRYDSKNKTEDSVVIDTETRGLEAEQAREKVEHLIKDIDFSEFRYVIKKIDSTLRGNIADEIAALDKYFQSELIVFAPAFPAIKRTTKDGIHMLDGIPITQTEISRDPKKPVKNDCLKSILEEGFEENVVHVSLSEVRQGFSLEGNRIFSFDAVEDSDLEKIITTVSSTGKKVLWVGTAGLANSIMELSCKTPPCLCVCGSVSDVTRQQVHIAEESGVQVVPVRIHELLSGENSEDTYIEQCIKQLQDNKDVILLSSATYDRTELEISRQYGEERHMTSEEVSVYTQETLGKIADSILSRCELSGVFVTGGDTAIGLLEQTGAEGSEILSEIAMGIPMMKIVGGKYAGMKLVTKAGAFGKEDALTYAIRKLKEREE